MSHSHEHVHAETYDPSYYMEQLCTIGACGLLGGVAVMLYYQEMVRFILAPYLQIYVLWSGYALLGLAAIRGIFLWSSVGRAREASLHEHCHHDPDHCDHDHDHAHEHEHPHMHEEEPAALTVLDHHHDHDDDHGHSHGWKPWRYMVLCLPLMLYFLNLPNRSYSSTAEVGDVQDAEHAVQEKKGDTLKLEFKELERWAYNELQRDHFEGMKGTLKGQFAPGKNDKMFGLVRFKITCCAADVIPLNVVILSPESINHVKKDQWVEVTGRIEFRKKRDREEYIPVLQLQSRNDVQLTEPDFNPYIQ
jgi:uncharacterized repeat protein (TIGR03943 family)